VTTPIDDVLVNGVALAANDVVYEITVSHGRSDITSSPQPSSATIRVQGAAAAPAEVGDELEILAYGFDRFLGNVTDLTWNNLGDGTPVVTVTAMGRLALLGYKLTDPANYVKETVYERVDRVLTDSGMDYLNGATPDLDLFNPSKDVPFSCTTALAEIAQWSGGTYFDTPSGWIVFESYGIRGTTAHPGNWASQVTTWAQTNQTWDSFPATLAAPIIPGTAVAQSPEWRKTSTAVVNRVTITHGTSESVDTFDDTDSQTAYGLRAVELTTELDALADATDRANQILLAQAYPLWNLGNVTVHVGSLTTTLRDQVLDLTNGSTVIVDGLPTDSPYTQFQGIVEGWTETYTPGQHWLTLSLSDPRFSYQTVTWANVDPALQWEDVNPALEWYNVVTADDLAA
jgi:hypothetical protein